MVSPEPYIVIAAGCAGFAIGSVAGGRLARASRRLPAGLAGAAVFAAVTARYGLTLECAQLLGFACALLALSLADLESRVIPNWCIAAALLVRLAYIALAWALGTDMSGVLAASLAGFAALGAATLAAAFLGDRLLGQESLGGGDVKLFAAAGFYFGWERGLAVVFISCLLGLATSPFSARGEDRSFPFGPAISAACVIMMLLGASAPLPTG